MDETALLAYRAEADQFFKHDEQSPLTPKQRETFTQLDWFPPNPVLVFEIQVEEFAEKLDVWVPTSGEKPPRLFQRWRQLRFELDGKAYTLTLLYNAEHDSFFLGFWDATNGTDTYGGGRYINPERLGDNRFRIDFNRAYNPYCAYNDRWSCLLPPPENRLPIRIEAGQKAFEKA
ncbi:MAG: DUF1684 domain-containing protein [Chloroflexi bacterium]|nr:DUF1684 domain-containing protein [Chloroflexota bacterium]